MMPEAQHGKIAVILFSMGGPDHPSAIHPFLFNLFNDPAILSIPAIIRPLLAWIIASRRLRPATEIYRHLGGCSPLLGNTLAQAQALEASLALDPRFRVFVVMRYWHPFAKDVAKAVKDYDPERILLLPLYPQWSTTTQPTERGGLRRNILHSEDLSQKQLKTAY